MSKLIAVSILFLTGFLSLPAGAVGKITVDPNTGPPKISGETISGADVAQKVTYEAKRKTVSSILAELSTE